MSSSYHTRSTRTIIWAESNQQRMVKDAAACAGLEVIVAASDSPESAADLAKALKCDRVDDIRKVIHHSEVDLYWLASPRPLDAVALRSLRETGVTIMTCEPQFATMPELGGDSPVVDQPVFVPRMRQSPGFRAASDILPQFGQAQCVNVFFRSGPGQGKLYARLYDAMDVITSMCDHTQGVNAALAGPLATIPDQLEHLRGHLTVNMRFKSNRCACAALSDSAGSWFRGVTVLGEGGCLRISDAGFDWIGPAGNTIESHSSQGSTLAMGELIGMQIKRLLSTTEVADVPPDNASLMALCEAARLSCLTGQDESPGKLMEMLSRP